MVTQKHYFEKEKRWLKNSCLNKITISLSLLSPFHLKNQQKSNKFTNKKVTKYNFSFNHHIKCDCLKRRPVISACFTQLQCLNFCHKT